jgi:aldehyde:ferredoxin oxidoreductase
MNADDYAELLSAAIGVNWSGADILEAGDRIWNLEKLFNLASGVDPSQDTLPNRLLNVPIAEGPSKGEVARLSEMLPLYYKLRGWTEEGIPTEETKKRLGL